MSNHEMTLAEIEAQVRRRGDRVEAWLRVQKFVEKELRQSKDRFKRAIERRKKFMVKTQ